MRVAVCISGQMRTYRKAQPSLMRHLVAPNAADVFVDTWDMAGNTNKLTLLLPLGFSIRLPQEYWHAQPDLMCDERCRFEIDLPNLYAELQSISAADDTVTEAALQALYAPVAARIETFDPAYFERTLEVSRLKRLFPDTTGLNAAPMFYKINRCDHLRREHERCEGFTYDVVVRTRPDLEFFSDVSFSTDDVRGKIWALFNPYYEMLGVAETNTNDMFFVGDAETMAYAADLWQDLPRHWNPDIEPERSFADRGPERILNDHLKARRLQGSVLKLDPPPNRVVPAIDYPRLLVLLGRDAAQMGRLPDFVGDCVALAQSQYAIHILALGDGERAEQVLKAPAQIGTMLCAEPFVGRAKLATILNRPAGLDELLASASEAGQQQAFPELFAPAAP